DPNAASRAELQLVAAVRSKPVLQVSARTSEGIDACWKAVRELYEARRADGRLAARRREQSLSWMWDLVNASLNARFRARPAVRAALQQTVAAVTESKLAPATAAQSLLDLFGS